MPEDEEREPGIDDTDPPEQPSFYDALERAVSVLRSAGKSDAVSEIEYRVNGPGDISKGLLHEIRTTRGYGTQVADDLMRHVTAEQERVAELQRRSEAEDREVRKAALVAERAEAARIAAEKQRDAELLAEIERKEAEDAAKVSGQPTQDDLAAKVDQRWDKIVEKTDALRTLPFGPEREAEYEALQMLVAGPRTLADVMTDPKKMAAEKVDAWDAADAETRGLAQKLGVAAPFDIDISSDEYQAQLEAARKKKADDEAFINQQQTASGRS